MRILLAPCMPDLLDKIIKNASVHYDGLQTWSYADQSEGSGKLMELIREAGAEDPETHCR